MCNQKKIGDIKEPYYQPHISKELQKNRAKKNGSYVSGCQLKEQRKHIKS
jgi:hypothetical protein